MREVSLAHRGALRAMLTALFVLAWALLGLSARAQPHGPDHAAVEAAFDAIMGPQNEVVLPVIVSPPTPWRDDSAPISGAAVEVSLGAFDALWQATRASAAARSFDRIGPAVVLGAARYEGGVEGEILRLDLALSLTLHRPGAWKTVPLVGPGAILADVVVDGERVGVTRRDGWWVWPTTRTGEVVVNLQLLVPARGPRGFIEFDFAGPRTPVTELSARFPVAGLEPRIDDAVRADVASEDGATTLSATLRPSTRVHIIGYRDLARGAAAESRVFAETLHLLSVDEDALEVFSELRYTILYAGAKHFDVHIPPGMTVVSAAGKGAFRWEIAPGEAGATVLRGETAFPIRDDYAISLRLRRDLARDGERFDVPLPRCLGVERDHGWVAVEVPGRLRLEEAARSGGVTPVDVRRLPAELVRSAVSPIMKAYRVAGKEATLALSAARLPERELAADSVDRVRAFTVVSSEGAAVTELRIAIRNRLRQSLAAQLPDGAVVRSVLVDGVPAKPSRDEAGRLMLPLKRSGRDGALLAPIMLQVVYATPGDALGLVGRRGLALPSFELPVDELEWTAFLPTENEYGELTADVASQANYWGGLRWLAPRASADDEEALWEEGAQALLEDGDEADMVTGEAGAMPVRIEVPQTGRELFYARYWLDAGQSVGVSFSYAQRGVRPAVTLFLVLLLAAALATALGPPAAGRVGVAVKVAAVGLAAASVVGLWWVASVLPIVVAVALGLMWPLLRRRSPRRAVAALRAWGRDMATGWQGREVAVARRGTWRRLARVAMFATVALVTWALVGVGVDLVAAFVERM